MAIHKSHLELPWFTEKADADTGAIPGMPSPGDGASLASPERAEHPGSLGLTPTIGLSGRSLFVCFAGYDIPSSTRLCPEPHVWSEHKVKARLLAPYHRRFPGNDRSHLPILLPYPRLRSSKRIINSDIRASCSSSLSMGASFSRRKRPSQRAGSLVMRSTG
jgi:hypothetical protein